MTVHNLQYLLRPRSVAVIGASNRPGSVGTTIMHNLLTGGFTGPVMPVNPRHQAIGGVLAYADVSQLPLAPELAVICTPAPTVAGIISALGRAGTRAAVVISAGFDAAGEQALLDAARPHGLRILGPNCLGLVVPPLSLNASFAPGTVSSGRLAFISQSGAMATVVLDWARAAGIGFSHFISLGNGADTDFGDLLDYLGGDPGTSAILLYVESIRGARKFLSAGRAAARNKPVIVLKAGRSPAGQQAAASHTGALASSDAVYSAAFSRAGMLRVYEFAELFAATETLARCRTIRGDRLLILTNGGGPGVLATDAHVSGGGRMAELDPQSLASLDQVLPAGWSRSNPLDIVGDGSASRYRQALEVLAGTEIADAVLLIHAPTAVAGSDTVARELLPLLVEYPLPVLSCWPGGHQAQAARQLAATAGIPAYATPEDAVTALRHIVEYQRNQTALMQTPPWPPDAYEPDLAQARELIAAARSAGHTHLNADESQQLLACFGIPAAAARVARNPAEAAAAAATLGAHVALKVLSDGISHKSDVGGVVLDLPGPDAVATAAAAMLDRIRAVRPEARVDGFLVQEMARRPGAEELIAGIGRDPVFGPVIIFGHGGTAVEVRGDHSIGLPPLNPILAEQMIARTAVYRLLCGYRDRPAARLAAITEVLVRLAQLAIELPEIRELDINPLLADQHGVIALDARVILAQPGEESMPAIRPYPRHLEEQTLLDGQPVMLRPIRPEDEEAHRCFLEQLTPADVRFRFFGLVREFPHSELARHTQIDYDREMAFIATRPAADGKPETLGVVHAMADPDSIRAEFAIVIRSDLKGRGLGLGLMNKIISYSRERGLQELLGYVLRSNRAMLGMAHRLGFETIATDEEQHTVRLKLR